MTGPVRDSILAVVDLTQAASEPVVRSYLRPNFGHY